MARTFLKIAYIVEFGGFVASISKEPAAAIWLSHNARPLRYRAMERRLRNCPTDKRTSLQLVTSPW